MKLLTVTEVAQELGVCQSRVRALIAQKRLKARKLARDWRIRPEDIEAVRVRKVGRPRKRSNG